MKFRVCRFVPKKMVSQACRLCVVLGIPAGSRAKGRKCRPNGGTSTLQIPRLKRLNSSRDSRSKDPTCFIAVLTWGRPGHLPESTWSYAHIDPAQLSRHLRLKWLVRHSPHVEQPWSWRGSCTRLSVQLFVALGQQRPRMHGKLDDNLKHHLKILRHRICRWIYVHISNILNILYSVVISTLFGKSYMSSIMFYPFIWSISLPSSVFV